jgi:hypothetical protein
MLYLGSEFEKAMIAAANMNAANVDPGSMRIDHLGDPTTTVRFTVVREVPLNAVKQAIRDAIQAATPSP